jgi:hypothetical protein
MFLSDENRHWYGLEGDDSQPNWFVIVSQNRFARE